MSANSCSTGSLEPIPESPSSEVSNSSGETAVYHEASFSAIGPIDENPDKVSREGLLEDRRSWSVGWNKDDEQTFMCTLPNAFSNAEKFESIEDRGSHFNGGQYSADADFRTLLGPTGKNLTEMSSRGRTEIFLQTVVRSDKSQDDSRLGREVVPPPTGDYSYQQGLASAKSWETFQCESDGSSSGSMGKNEPSNYWASESPSNQFDFDFYNDGETRVSDLTDFMPCFSTTKSVTHATNLYNLELSRSSSVHEGDDFESQLAELKSYVMQTNRKFMEMTNRSIESITLKDEAVPLAPAPQKLERKASPVRLRTPEDVSQCSIYNAPTPAAPRRSDNRQDFTETLSPNSYSSSQAELPRDSSLKERKETFLRSSSAWKETIVLQSIKTAYGSDDQVLSDTSHSLHELQLMNFTKKTESLIEIGVHQQHRKEMLLIQNPSAVRCSTFSAPSHVSSEIAAEEIQHAGNPICELAPEINMAGGEVAEGNEENVALKTTVKHLQEQIDIIRAENIALKGELADQTDERDCEAIYNSTQRDMPESATIQGPLNGSTNQETQDSTERTIHNEMKVIQIQGEVFECNEEDTALKKKVQQLEGQVEVLLGEKMELKEALAKELKRHDSESDEKERIEIVIQQLLKEKSLMEGELYQANEEKLALISRMQKLEEEAERAIYERISAEEKFNKVLKERQESSSKDKQKMENAMQQLVREKKVMENEIIQAHNETSALQSEIRHLEEKIERMTAEGIAAQEMFLEESKKTAAETAMEIEALKAQINTLTDEKTEAEETLREEKIEKDSLERVVEHLKETIQVLESDKMESWCKLAAAKNNTSNAGSEIATLRQQVKSLSADKLELEHKVRNHEECLIRNQQIMGDLKSKISECVVRRQDHAFAAFEAHRKMIYFLSDKENTRDATANQIGDMLEKLKNNAKDPRIAMHTNAHDAESEEKKKVLASILIQLNSVS